MDNNELYRFGGNSAEKFSESHRNLGDIIHLAYHGDSFIVAMVRLPLGS